MVKYAQSLRLGAQGLGLRHISWDAEEQTSGSTRRLDRAVHVRGPPARPGASASPHTVSRAPNVLMILYPFS